MNKFSDWIEHGLLPPLAKLAEQKHLRAIRDGIIATMPLIIIGSLFTLIVNFPVPAWTDLIEPYNATIMLPYRITVGLMSLFAAYGMGNSLAKSYNLDGVSGGTLSLGAFLMTMTPAMGVLEETGESLGWVLPMEYLGGSGMFGAILSMIVAVEILRFFQEKNITIKLPEQVPSSVSRSFEAMIPGAVVITLMWFISHVINFNLNETIMTIFSPITEIAGNSYFGVLIPVLLITVLWAAGIHGVSVVGSLIRPIWLVLLEQNITALAEGEPIPNIGTEGFFDLFVWIGGSGGTLAVCLLFLFSKSEYMKQMGKVAIIPGLFNINEPIIFGAPIVLNPILAIPFVLGPVVTTTITYIAMNLNLVAKVSVVTPFTIPAPIKAYLSTNGDWRAIILVLINFAIYLAIYYPFIKAYDKKMLAEESASENTA